MAACVALAVGGHVVFLVRGAPDAGHQPHEAATALTVRLQAAEEPAKRVPQPEADEPAVAAALLSQAPAATPAETPALSMSNEPAPSFDGGPPGIDFPDAPLPEGGADVRAFLVLDNQGAAQSVITAAAPGLPAGFQRLTELGLKQARLHAGQGAQYCLLVRFEPEASSAKLAWLPGAAKDAARCLAGALPAPREIVAPAP